LLGYYKNTILFIIFISFLKGKNVQNVIYLYFSGVENQLIVSFEIPSTGRASYCPAALLRAPAVFETLLWGTLLRSGIGIVFDSFPVWGLAYPSPARRPLPVSISGQEISSA
jgi:hypothetical protein